MIIKRNHLFVRLILFSKYVFEFNMEAIFVSNIKFVDMNVKQQTCIFILW